MHIVTLTTDFGLQDYYVPVLKGAMLSRHAELNFVDVSHNIKNHDIVQAAFVLKNTWRSFPEGTIHVASVNNFGGERHRFLVILHQNHYFIGPDNGIFSLIFEDTPQYVYEIPFAGLNFAPVRDCLADAVGYIASAKPIADIGLAVTDMVQRITLQPVISPNQIRGSVIHIDNYDNVITNVTQDLFHKVGHGRPFQLYFKRHDPITALSTHYNDVTIGETLCLFNSDYLEITINMGKAAEMLGLKVEDTIQIDFLSEVGEVAVV
jgi:S-adenosyl-L-methionine hydrolase (adenosine-forming)